MQHGGEHGHVFSIQKNAPVPAQPAQPPKTLRFVTNYGAPHPKRRRIGAACLTCRKRKTACSGERPHCETCGQNKLDCAGYSDAAPTPQKRTTSDAGPTKLRDQSGMYKAESHGRNMSSPTRKMSPGQGRFRSASSPPSDLETRRPDASHKDGERSQEPLFAGLRNRMPYFRWLGPTAIMPGFKQMVVKIRRENSGGALSSTDGGPVRSPTGLNPKTSEPLPPGLYTTTSTGAESEIRDPLILPFYDTSPVPPSELITHLANTFFTHLGCNYPFLQRKRFMRDLEEKQVDAILVDAVCALAARFSTHPLLTQASNDPDNKNSPAEYGHAFAQRAKTALIDTFACPSVAAAQAALLLAYNEFGEQRDSGLWMYLGISIRLAQDLGLHKVEGLKYVGKDGPTPKMVKREFRKLTRFASSSASPPDRAVDLDSSGEQSETANQGERAKTQHEIEEQRAVEQERVDTFWAIFFLDRMVSSGTGRRSTLRDNDIELSFPSPSEANKASDWPAPFPALIRIVHLYGRVADLLNSLKEPSDITADTPKRLAAMENQVTKFYQGLSPRLHFDAVNFQHYMKTGEGTNFVLLHFWFHMLIVLLHQPTLLMTFAGPMLQLFPNSQQLSMSSAKTIADILSYSQLIDEKAALGNPFTTQPIYIAACAFLKETVDRTASSSGQSRAPSPSRAKDTSDLAELSSGEKDAEKKEDTTDIHRGEISLAQDRRRSAENSEQRSSIAKHTLLATAASQHYQLCYKALQSLEVYWAGTKYILTVLEQKFRGVGDPLLYTAEEGESSLVQPRPEPAFTSPGWRRKLSWGSQIAGANIAGLQSQFWPPKGLGQATASSSGVDPGKAIGWTLTGTMNSPSTHLAWHYAGGNANGNPNIDPRLSAVSASGPNAGQLGNSGYDKHVRTTSMGSQGPSNRNGRLIAPPYTGGSITLPKTATDPLAGFSTTYPQDPTNGVPPSFHHQESHGDIPMSLSNEPIAPSSGPIADGHLNAFDPASTFFISPGGDLPANLLSGDMTIESQDVDMSALGLDMMPWFDSYPTNDVMGMYGSGSTTGGVNGTSSDHTGGHQ